MSQEACSKVRGRRECGHGYVDFEYCGHLELHQNNPLLNQRCWQLAKMPTQGRGALKNGGCSPDCNAKLYGWLCCNDKVIVPVGSSPYKHDACGHERCSDCQIQSPQDH